MRNHLSCNVVQDLLPQYVEKLLSPESEEEVAAHLRECEACREMYWQMNSPEPLSIEAVREVDYLKKVKRDRIKLVTSSVLFIAAILVGSAFFLRMQRAISKEYAAKADEYEVKASEYAALASENARIAEENRKRGSVCYDETSKTVIVFGAGDEFNLVFPKELQEAKSLYAQFESFHMSVYLPTLTSDEPMDSFLFSFLDRTKRSMRFLRSYLLENCAEWYSEERANKYVEVSITKDESYGWRERDERISLEMGSQYWYRDTLYLLSLLGSERVEWKELGYAWYLGCCVDPYNEYASKLRTLQDSPCYEAFTRIGGTQENTPENMRKLSDAVAFTCLEQGMWWGSSCESYPLKHTTLYLGPRHTTDPGNEMSIMMASSFIGYLVQVHGFDRVSAFCFGKLSFEEAFSTDFTTAYGAWTDWIRESCGTAS